MNNRKPDYYRKPQDKQEKPDYYRKTPDKQERPDYYRNNPDPENYKRSSYARPQEDKWTGCCYESELASFIGKGME